MWDLIQKGGPMMYLIMLSSVIAFGIVIERVYHLNRARIDADKFMDSLMGVLKRNKIIEAIELCNATPGPIAPNPIHIPAPKSAAALIITSPVISIISSFNFNLKIF